MKKEDILLLYIYLPVKEPNIVSPIQIMKGLFIFSKEMEIENFYEFEPYLYGPCSFEVYDHLHYLVKNRLVTTIRSILSSWSYYKTTPLGNEKCKQIIQSIEPKIVKKLKEVKSFVVNKSFIDLLCYIYEKYPEYAVKSIIDIRGIK